MKNRLLTVAVLGLLVFTAKGIQAQDATINYVQEERSVKPQLGTLLSRVPFVGKNGFRSCAEILPAPEINLYTSYGKLQYDFSRDRAHLTGAGKKFGIIEQGLFASGLAVVEVAWEISLNTLSHTLDNGQICVVPSSVDVYIGYQNPVIYVDNALKPHTCEYNLVIRHEQTHQQINKTALEYFLPMFYNAIDRIAKSVEVQEVRQVKDIDGVTAELTRQYAIRLEPLIELFKRELMLEQGKLDNHTNYEMEGQLCKKPSRRQR